MNEELRDESYLPGERAQENRNFYFKAWDLGTLPK